MSGDEDDLEGENEKSFWEHFAPVTRSLKRTVTSRSMQAYAVSFVGVLVLSASIGGVVVGAYAAVQEDLGLCGNPILEVRSSEDTDALVAGDAAPNPPQLEYEELTPAEQRGFREALNSVNNEEEVEGNVEHLTTFRNGALVTYRGEEHYVAVSSFNKCVPFDALSVPLSIVGLIVGAGLYVAPGLWRRFR
jgi:hypothetical protein